MVDLNHFINMYNTWCRGSTRTIFSCILVAFFGLKLKSLTKSKTRLRMKSGGIFGHVCCGIWIMVSELSHRKLRYKNKLPNTRIFKPGGKYIDWVWVARVIIRGRELDIVDLNIYLIFIKGYVWEVPVRDSLNTGRYRQIPTRVERSTLKRSLSLFWRTIVFGYWYPRGGVPPVPPAP